MPSVTERLDEARRPEDLFGCLLGNASERRALLDRTYQILLEKSPEEKRRLDDAYRAARDALVRGSYGRILVSVSLRQLHGEKGDYALIQRLEADESIEQWLARSASGDELLLRRALDDQGQALLRQEARALHRLNGQGAVEGRLRAYVPTLLDSFPSASNSHLVNVFTPLDGLVSLAEVRVAYPDGVPARDAIWMLRRLLIAVGFGHVNGLVNASVLPENVLIHPQEHGLVLADWGHSYERGKRQVSFSGEPEWRPTEIAASQCPLPATDIYLAARCFQYLLGATPGAWRLPASVPDELAAFLASLVASSPAARPDDAWALIGELDELTGPREFRPFVMPQEAEESAPDCSAPPQRTQQKRGRKSHG